MKIAAIDIGTNSTRLLIVQAEKNIEGKVISTPIVREMKITRLGRNLEQTKLISEEGSAQTIEVLKNYQKYIQSYDVVKYKAAGTRVLRLAENADVFLNRVFTETGLKVEVVSGRQEAFLSFSGAISGLDDEKVFKTRWKAFKERGRCSNILVVDIGGGSTEFILGKAKDQTVVYIDSINIGSVTLSEKFLSDDKIPDKETIEKLLYLIEKRLKDSVEKINLAGFAYMVGLAGTISSLSAMDLEICKYDREKIHGHILQKGRIKDIFQRLCLADLKERKNIKGLEPERADIIIGGTAILLKILEMLHIESLVVSENDILDGIINSLMS